MPGRNKITLILVALLLLMLALIYYFHKPDHKVDKQSVSANDPIKDTTGNSVLLYRFDFDLEESRGLLNTGSLDTTHSASGKYSCILNKQIEYGVNVVIPFQSIQGWPGISGIKGHYALWSENVSGAQWVLEIKNNKDSTLLWQSVEIPSGKHRWDTSEFSFTVPMEFIQQENTFKFYPWNKNFAEFKLDNISISFFGIPSSVSAKKFRKVNFEFDMESDSGLDGLHLLTSDFSYSGKRSVILAGKDSYGTAISKKVYEVCDDSLKKLAASVRIYPENSNPDVLLVASISNENNEQVHWMAREMKNFKLKGKTWHKVNAEFIIPPEVRMKIGRNDKISVYLWNKSRMKIFADDLVLVFGNEPERQGSYPNVNFKLATQKIYSFDRYNPPHPAGSFIYADVGNMGSPFLVNNDTAKSGELFPDDLILNVRSSGRTSDLILHVSEDEAGVYEFCHSAGKFRKAGTVKFPDWIKDVSNVITADMDGDGNTEILCLIGDTGHLLRLDFAEGGKCDDAEGKITFQEIWKGDIPLNSYCLADDFDEDGKAELLFLNKEDKRWELITYAGGILKEKKAGEFRDNVVSDLSAQLSGNFLPGYKGKQLLMVNASNEGGTCALLEYNAHTSAFRMIESSAADHVFNRFSSGDQLLKFKENGIDNILWIPESGRFEIRLISGDNKGLYIKAQMDFEGSSDSVNPKYYEMIKPYTGRYMNESSDALLLSLRNCADKDFTGQNCSVFGGSPELPDRIQMYQLKNILKDDR